MDNINELQRTGSTFDKGGTIGKRKKIAIIVVAVLVVTGAIIGLAVGVSQAKKNKHHDDVAKAPAPTPTPTDTSATTPTSGGTRGGSDTSASSVSKAQSESMQRITTQEAVGAKITPEVLDEFLNKVRAAGNTFGSFIGQKIPEQPLTSHTLLIYIYEMDVKSIWDALVAFVQDKVDPKDMDLPDLTQLVKDVKTMYSEEGLRAWGKAKSVVHHKMERASVKIAELAKMMDPDLKELDDNINVTSGMITYPIIRNDGTGRRLMGSVEAGRQRAVEAHEEGGAFSTERRADGVAPCSDADQELKDVMRSFPGAARKLQQKNPTKKKGPCIPIVPLVFHILQYRDPATNKLYPSPDSWREAAERMARRLNYSFSNPELSKEFKKPAMDARLRFRVDEVRTDVKKYSYLEVPYDTWAKCGTRDFSTTMQNIAEKGNKDVTLYPNIYICGEPGYGNPSGYAWVPYREADSTRKWDHIFIFHDAASISGLNRKEAFWGGPWTLAHEMGHYFGLSHTQYDDAVECTDGDGFSDTELTLSSQDQPYYAALTNICETWRLTPNKWPSGKQWVASKDFNNQALSSMSSCAPKNTFDPVFNIMSYTADPCMSHFTAEQVEYMRYVARTFRKKMFVKWRVCLG